MKDKDDDDSQYINSIVLSEKKLLVALDYNYIFLTDELEIISDIDRKELDPCVRRFRCLSESYNKKAIILALSA